MPLPGDPNSPRFAPSGAESKPRDTELRPRSVAVDEGKEEAETPPPRTTPRTESPSPRGSSSPTIRPRTESASPSPATESPSPSPQSGPPLRDDGTPFVIKRYKRPGASPLDLLPDNVREGIEAATETAEQAALAAYEAAKRNKRTTAAIASVFILGGLYLAARRR